MQLKNIAISAVFCSALWGGTCVFAQEEQGPTDTTSFEVTLRVAESCTVTAGGPIDFDEFKIGTALPLVGSTDIEVTCTLGTGYGVGLQSNNLAVDGEGEMIGGDGTIRYSLFQNEGLTVLWGNDGGTRLSGEGTGLPQPHRVWAKVLDANVAPGSYSDTVTVTMHF